jgi:membrane protease YdiL (CAAX protease family)
VLAIDTEDKKGYHVITSGWSIFERKYFDSLHKIFANKKPDRILAIGTDILKKRIKASTIRLHLADISVRGHNLYSHNPRERSLDFYEPEHEDMVPPYVAEFYKSGSTEPETIKFDSKFAILVPLVSTGDERVGIMEIVYNKSKKLSKTETEELDYYAEAFVSIIDDHRKQKQQLGMMSDMNGMLVLLVMWTTFFMSTSLVYFFSPYYYDIVYFVFLAVILAAVFLVFYKHIHSYKGWGLSWPEFFKSLHIYILVALGIVGIGAILKYYGLFGIPKNLGGSMLIFDWNWKDIMYPISVPLQELGARAMPHVILRQVLKGPYKTVYIVTISSMVFGFGHLFFGLPLVFLTFLIGLILGTVYEYKRNFWGICLIHMMIGYLVMTGLGYQLLLGIPK